MHRLYQSLVFILCTLIIPSYCSFIICNNSAAKNGSDCITYVHEPRNFSDAQKYCKSQFGADLVTLVTTKDVEMVHKELSSQTVNDSWIGLHDMTVSHSFRWISGYPSLPQGYWEENSTPIPDHLLCVIMSKGNALTSWKMENCSRLLPFFCGPLPRTISRDLLLTNGSCPPNFVRIANRCFNISGEFNEELKTWSEARDACKRLHSQADLATVASVDEQNMMTAYMGHMMHSLWIGLRLVNGERVWVNNATVTFTNWKAGEPNNKDSMSCTLMYSRLQNLGQWNDENCQKKTGYMCEVPLQSSTNGTTDMDLFQRGGCASGFVEYHSTCYKVLSPFGNYTMDQAWSTCAALDTSKKTFLVNPHGQFEAAFLRALISRERWLQKDSGTSISAWIGTVINMAPDQTISWNNSDDSTMSQLERESALPMSLSYELLSKTGAKCFLASSTRSHLVMVPCDKPRVTKPICSYKLENHPEHSGNGSSGGNLTCPGSWTPYGVYCYRPFSAKMSFDAAEAACMKVSAHLVSIHSNLEKQNIVTMLKSRGILTDVWIGLTAVDNARRSSEAIGLSFRWTDGSAFNFYAFRTGEPSRTSASGAAERCVVIRGNTWEWNDVQCSTQTGYVCKMPAVNQTENTTILSTSTSTTSTTTTTTTTTMKPTTPSVEVTCDGFLSHGTCGKLMPEQADWQTAEMNCVRTGGHLLSFHSLNDTRNLKNYLLHTNPDPLQLWLGATWREFSLQPVSWSDGSALSKYLILPKRDTSPAFGSQLCLALDTSLIGANFTPPVYYPWLTLNCGRKLRYICAKSTAEATSHAISTPIPPTLQEGHIWTCPHGFSLYGTSCFKLVHEPVKFRDTKAKCQLLSAHIAIPESWEENLFLSSLGTETLGPGIWIGLHIDWMHGILRYMDVHKEIGSFLLPIGFAPHLNKSEMTRLVNLTTEKALVLSNTRNPHEQASWRMEDTRMQLPFFCQLDAIQQSKDASSSSGTHCAEGELMFENACYFVHVKQEKSIDEARATCRRHHKDAHLLYLNSVQEEHFLVSQMLQNDSLYSGKFSVWMGLQLPKVNYTIKQWKRDNGSPVLFTHFPASMPTPPTYLESNKRCVVLDVDKSSGTISMLLEQSCNDVTSSSPRVTVCKRPISGVTVDLMPHECLYVDHWAYMGTHDRDIQLFDQRRFQINHTQGLDVRRSRSGRACWRWDMISRASLLSSAGTVYDRFPHVEALYPGYGTYFSYLENRCGVFEQLVKPMPEEVAVKTYGCYVSSTEWEACDVEPCPDLPDSYHGGAGVAILMLIFLFLLFAVIGGLVYLRYRHRCCFRYSPLERYPTRVHRPMFTGMNGSHGALNREVVADDMAQHDRNHFEGTAFYNPTYQPFV